MTSKLTAGDIENLIGYLTPGQYTFMQALNLVMDRFYNSGIWKDLLARMSFPNGSPDGIINLDYQYASLVGLSLKGGSPMAIYDQTHPWQELSFGYVDPADYTMSGVEDMGDGFPAPVDISTEGTLKLTLLDAEDAGKTARFFGLYDSNQFQVRDTTGALGINLTLASPSSSTTQTFSTLTGVQLPGMVGLCQLSVVNGSTVTLLAEYEPGQTRPAYRRYKTGKNDAEILAFCRKRPPIYANATDFVEPANIGAIGTGFQAITKELSQQFDEANKIWAYAKELLNEQLKSFRGSAKPIIKSLGKQLASGPSTSFW